MTCRLAIVAAMAALWAPAAVFAATATTAAITDADLIGRLERYCVATDSRPSQAIMAAAVDGFTHLQFADTAELRNAQIRTDASGAMALVLGTLSDVQSIPGYHFEACMVAVQHLAPGDTLHDTFAAWVGGPPIESNESGRFYMAYADASGRHGLDGLSRETLSSLLTAGGLHAAASIASSGGGGVIWATARPDGPAGAQPHAAGESSPPRTSFADFQALCVAGGAEPARALAAAAGAGWSPVALDSLPPFPVKILSGEARLKPADQGVGVLLAGRGRYLFDTTELRFQVCGLYAEGAAGRELAEAASAWAGVSPAETYPDKSRVYLFTGDADHRRPIANVETEGAIARAAARSPVWILIVAASDRMVALGRIETTGQGGFRVRPR